MHSRDSDAQNPPHKGLLPGTPHIKRVAHAVTRSNGDFATPDGVAIDELRKIVRSKLARKEI